MTATATTTAEQLLEHLLARHTSNGRHDQDLGYLPINLRPALPSGRTEPGPR